MFVVALFATLIAVTLALTRAAESVIHIAQLSAEMVDRVSGDGGAAAALIPGIPAAVADVFGIGAGK